MKYSVVIPTYNRAHILPEVLRSVLEAVANFNAEIIVVDDGSTDRTRKIVENLPVRYFRLDYPSGGPASPRNYGASLASGEFLCFLDSDDLWSAKKIYEIDKLLDEIDLDFIYHSFEGFKARKLSFLSLLFRNEIVTSSVVVRKSTFEEFNGFNTLKNLRSVEDYDLWIRIFQSRSVRIGYLDETLGFYSYSADRISGNKKLRRLNCTSLWQMHSPDLAILEKVVFLVGLTRVYFKNII